MYLFTDLGYFVHCLGLCVVAGINVTFPHLRCDEVSVDQRRYNPHQRLLALGAVGAQWLHDWVRV